MHILIVIVLSLALIAFVVYKINNKFGVKEMAISIAVAILIGIASSFFTSKKEENVQDIFKQKYEENTNSKVLKLSAERLNNKNVSSDTKFIYRFNLIVNKNDKELVCTIDKVTISKIQDEFIIDSYKEICKEK